MPSEQTITHTQGRSPMPSAGWRIGQFMTTAQRLLLVRAQSSRQHARAPVTLREAQRIVRDLGFTLKHDPALREYCVHARGANVSHLGAYFTDDLADAVGTARAMAKERGISEQERS